MDRRWFLGLTSDPVGVNRQTAELEICGQSLVPLEEWTPSAEEDIEIIF